MVSVDNERCHISLQTRLTCQGLELSLKVGSLVHKRGKKKGEENGKGKKTVKEEREMRRGEEKGKRGRKLKGMGREKGGEGR